MRSVNDEGKPRHLPDGRRRRRTGGPGIGAALGAAMVDLEQHLLRSRPRVEERHRRRDEVTMAATDGTRVTLEIPKPGEPGPE